MALAPVSPSSQALPILHPLEPLHLTIPRRHSSALQTCVSLQASLSSSLTLHHRWANPFRDKLQHLTTPCLPSLYNARLHSLHIYSECYTDTFTGTCSPYFRNSRSYDIREDTRGIFCTCNVLDEPPPPPSSLDSMTYTIFCSDRYIKPFRNVCSYVVMYSLSPS